MKKGIIFLISAIILIIILLVFFIPKGLPYLSKHVWCQKEGGDLQPYMNKYSDCCPGLEKITNSSNYDELCNNKGYLGNYGICSQCGNSNCEQWESRCNCPEDCK